VSSICAGLLLAFCPVMWSQAVITEVYGLNVCCLMATLVVLYRWSFEPEKRWRLYLAALIWGVGLTAHQTLVLLTVAFPTFIWFTDRKFGRAVLVPILLVCGLGLLVEAGEMWTTIHKLAGIRERAFAAGNQNAPSPWDTYTFPFLVCIGLAGGVGYWLYRLLKDRDWRGSVMTILGVIAVGGMTGGLVLRFLENDTRGSWMMMTGFAALVGFAAWAARVWNRQHEDVRHASQALLVYGAVCLGLGLYGYLYFSSCTNPPMNWGHCSEWEGFKHQFTRGQYDKVHLDRTLLQFWGQLNMFFDDLQGQFNILYALLALFALFFFRDLETRDRNWLLFLLIGFLCLGIGLSFCRTRLLKTKTVHRPRFFSCRVIVSIRCGLATDSSWDSASSSPKSQPRNAPRWPLRLAYYSCRSSRGGATGAIRRNAATILVTGSATSCFGRGRLPGNGAGGGSLRRYRSRPVRAHVHDLRRELRVAKCQKSHREMSGQRHV